MKIAIPDWNGRISPVFDVAETILFVDLAADGGRSDQRLLCPSQAPAQRAEFLSAAGVETLICCAISRPLEMAAVAAGISVIPHICGGVEDILEAFVQGGLDDTRYRMPGWCGRQRRLRCGRRGRHNSQSAPLEPVPVPPPPETANKKNS